MIRALIAWLVACAAVPVESSVFTRYTSHDGLAYDRVLRIVRDSRGFLWFCTGEGLSRFDGQRFRNFGTAEGLPAAYVADLLESRDGSYWVATDGGGGARFRPQAPAGEKPFTVVSVGTDPASAKVSRLAQDPAGTLWAGTMGGLFRLDSRDGRFVPVPLGLPGVPDRSVRIWALTAAADGTLWVGHDHGLSRVRANGAEIEHFAIHATPSERAFVAEGAQGASPLRATLLWSAKEAVMKALGEGLRLAPQAVEVVPSMGTASGAGWRRFSVAAPPVAARLHGFWCTVGGFVLTVVGGPGEPLQARGATR